MKSQAALRANRKYLLTHPWMRTLTAIRTRCYNKNQPNYKWYGARGIKCQITKDEIRYLWVRDRAGRNEMMAVRYGYVHEGPVSTSLARLLLDTPQPEIQVEVCDN